MTSIKPKLRKKLDSSPLSLSRSNFINKEKKPLHSLVMHCIAICEEVKSTCPSDDHSVNKYVVSARRVRTRHN